MTGTGEKAPRVGRGVGSLLAVNTGLLVALIWQWAGPSTVVVSEGSQPEARSPREPGRYTLVSGAYLGGLADAVYVVDAAHRELAAFRYDPGTGAVRIAGFRDLSRDAETGAGR